MAKAYSYIRFSTPSQSGGDSFRRQTEDAREYADIHGLELDDLKFTDLGRSAFRGSNVKRGELKDFLRAVESGKVAPGSYLLVEALDRLSRAAPSTSQRLLLDLIEAGIVVVTLMDKRVYDKATVNRDPFALMDSVMKLYAAHEESRKKSERFEKLFKARRNKGAPIIGFVGPGWVKKRADKLGWELIPEKAESVRKLFEATLAGHGGVTLVKMANAEKWVPFGHRGTSWHQGSISKVLKNRACIGEYQPMRLDDGKLVPAGLPIPDYYPAVVSEEDFNLVQSTLVQRSRIPHRRDDQCRNVFAGMLICGSCGATLALKAGRTSDHYLTRYYACADRTRGLTQCPSFHAGDLLAPEGLAPRRYRKQKDIPTKALLATLMQHIAEHVSRDEKMRSIGDALNKAEAKLHALQVSQANLMAVAEAGGAGVAVLADRLRTVSEEIRGCEAEIEELTLSRVHFASIQTEEDIDASIEAAVMAVSNPAASAERMLLRDKLLQLVEHIWLWPGLARFRLRGEELPRTVLLAPEATPLLTNLPPIPPMRKHLKR